MCVQAVEVEIRFGLNPDKAQDRVLLLRRMLCDARGETSFASVSSSELEHLVGDVEMIKREIEVPCTAAWLHVCDRDMCAGFGD